MAPRTTRTTYPTPPIIDPATLRCSTRVRKPIDRYPPQTRAPKNKTNHNSLKSRKRKLHTRPLRRGSPENTTRGSSLMYEILVATPTDLEKGKTFKVSLHRIDGAESQPHDRRSRSCIVVYPGLDGVILNEHFEGKRMIGELSFWDKPILGPEGEFPREKIDE